MTATDGLRKIEPDRVRRTVLTVSLVLFGLACLMPALDLAWVPRTPESRPPAQAGSVMAGYEILLLGWMGAVFRQVGWYSNPLLAITWWCVWRRGWLSGAAFVLLALLLAADLRNFDAAQIPTDGRGSVVFALRQPLFGCYLWFASILVAGLASLLGWATERASAAEERPA